MNRPIRVLHSLSAIASGGVEARHLQIATQVTDGFEHRFIGTSGGALTDDLRARGVTVDLLGRVRSVLDPRRYVAGHRALQGWRPDLVHGAVMEGTTLGVILARRYGVPMLFEETSDPANRRFLGHRLVRLIASGATRCVAVSPAVGRYLIEDVGIKAAKVQVIINGVPRPASSSPDEQAQLRHSLGIGVEDVVIGSVSRLFDDHKRVTDLIAAFASLAGSRHGLHLVIVGDGRDADQMKAAASDTGFGDRIHFVGRHNPADAYYAIMDVFAIASSREAFGLVAAEAMRAGLPVVATRVGGLAEIVIDGRTGFLVPLLDPRSLASALQRLVDCRELREQMGTAGRMRADGCYSVERYLAEVRSLYLDLVDLAELR